MVTLLTTIEKHRMSKNKYLEILNSIPKNNILISGTGFKGGLEKSLDKKYIKENEIIYFLTKSDFYINNFHSQYFDTKKNSTIDEIHKLRIKLIFKRQSEKFVYGGTESFTIPGNINQIVDLFNRSQFDDPKKYLKEAIKNYDHTRKIATKNLLFNPHKKDIHPMYVSWGIETIDGKYTLKNIINQGPFIGSYKIKDEEFVDFYIKSK